MFSQLSGASREGLEGLHRGVTDHSPAEYMCPLGWAGSCRIPGPASRPTRGFSPRSKVTTFTLKPAGHVAAHLLCIVAGIAAAPN